MDFKSMMQTFMPILTNAIKSYADEKNTDKMELEDYLNINLRLAK